MNKDDSVRITSGLQKELCDNVTVKGKKYLVLTEDFGSKQSIVSTKIYSGGKIIGTKNTDYRNLAAASDTGRAVRELMQKQHETAVSTLKAKKLKKKMIPFDYLEEVISLLKKKDLKSALKLLTSALKQYPDDPFLLSYYGCLEAIINENYTYGIDICLRAIEIINEKMPFGQEFFYPVFHLNLGRAYLASGNRKKAVEAFYKGLSYDRENKDIIDEIEKLGMRRKPVIPYLHRSHPINIYIGKLLHKLKKGSV